VIAMAGKTCAMAENSMMMIHNPYTMDMGDADHLRKTADLLDQIKDTTVNIYAAKSGLGKKQLATMMDDETWMTAADAKENGMCDEIATPNKAQAAFDLSIFGYGHVPENFQGNTAPTDHPVDDNKAAKALAIAKAHDHDRAILELT
jgi:hypothetical protein